jgi:predicted Rossmann fold flavoprotein
VLEKNTELGKKLDITGGGRCNITNADGDIREFLAHYGAAQEYLFSPFAQFNSTETFSFFEKYGLPLTTEARGRVFPLSQKATDITRLLADLMRKYDVTVLTNTPVTSIRAEEGKITEVATHGATYTAENYILATGGVSHPETGSTGDGFSWLEKLGHTIEKPNPSLVPLKASDTWVYSLAGTALDSMKITFFADGVRSFSKTGRLLFTHFGISGPLILNSAKDVGELICNSTEVTATIDLFPDKEFAELDHFVLAILREHSNKLFRNVLREIVPPGMSGAIFDLLALTDPEVKTHSLPHDNRKRFIHLVKGVPLHITGLMGLDRSIVSNGGVMLNEVDTRTMKSRKVENLFVTGDLLNITRPSGGYSLQLCWTTGYVAGQHA